MQRFGVILADVRRVRGWTQAELARRTGFEPSVISRLETGFQFPLVVTLCRLADALDVTTDELLGRATR